MPEQHFTRVTDPKRVIAYLSTPEEWRRRLHEVRMLSPRTVAIIESHVCALEERIESLQGGRQQLQQGGRR